MPAALQANFQEPPSPDQTAAPPESVPQPPNPIQALQQRKKKPMVRNSGALASAIARSKRARQTGQKWGN